MTDDLSTKREQLVEQAAHLISELDALSSQVRFVSDDLLSSKPLELEPSIKEMYALLGLYDRDVYLPAIQKMVSLPGVALQEAVDDELLAGRSWSDEPFPIIMDFVRESRNEVLSVLRCLADDDWDKTAIAGERNLTVYDVVYGLIRHDAEISRAVARRFHDMRPSNF